MWRTLRRVLYSKQMTVIELVPLKHRKHLNPTHSSFEHQLTQEISPISQASFKNPLKKQPKEPDFLDSVIERHENDRRMLVHSLDHQDSETYRLAYDATHLENSTVVLYNAMSRKANLVKSERQGLYKQHVNECKGEMMNVTGLDADLSLPSSPIFKSLYTCMLKDSLPPSPVVLSSRKCQEKRIYDHGEFVKIDKVLNVKQVHSEGSTLVEEWIEDDLTAALKPFDKNYRLYTNQRHFFDQDDFDEDDNASNNSFTSFEDDNFMYGKGLLRRVIDFETEDGYEAFENTGKSPIELTVDENLNRKNEFTDNQKKNDGSYVIPEALNKRPTQAVLRKEKRHLISEQNDFPLQKANKWELSNEIEENILPPKNDPSRDRQMHEAFDKMAARSQIFRNNNSVGQMDVFLSGVECVHTPSPLNVTYLKNSGAQKVDSFISVREQRIYPHEREDAMVISIGYHPNWTRYIVPPTVDFYHQDGTRTDLVVAYTINENRQHPCAGFEKASDIRTWCLPPGNEESFKGYATCIHSDRIGKEIDLGPGLVKVIIGDDAQVHVIVTGRSRMKPWATSELPFLKVCMIAKEAIVEKEAMERKKRDSGVKDDLLSLDILVKGVGNSDNCRLKFLLPHLAYDMKKAIENGLQECRSICDSKFKTAKHTQDAKTRSFHATCRQPLSSLFSLSDN